METISFMPDIYYKTMYCQKKHCDLYQLCYYAHHDFELRSFKDSVPVVSYLTESKAQHRYFDDLEKNFVKNNPEFFL
jgi:hypothetical protein